MHDAATTPTATDTKPHQQGALDRDLFCPRLQRLLMGEAFELGFRGNLAQTIASIERGGAGGGSMDPDGAMVERLNSNPRCAAQLRALAEQFRQLSAKHQATALVHYLGTPRAHATIRQHFGSGDNGCGQGSLAGVVLYRWQLKQTKLREKGAVASGAGPTERLARLRDQLVPLERELATVEAVLDAPVPQAEPRPARPADPEHPPLVLRKSVIERQLREYWAPYRDACQVWADRDDVKALRAAQQARHAARQRLDALLTAVEPLRAQQARLCAELADAAATPAPAAVPIGSDGPASLDEQSLVLLCRSGNLDAAAHLGAAEADVRALHRAWRATDKASGLKRAKAWADGESAA